MDVIKILSPNIHTLAALESSMLSSFEETALEFSSLGLKKNYCENEVSCVFQLRLVLLSVY